MKDLARHLLLELHECDADVLNDADQLQQILVQAAGRLRATILEVFAHRFHPQGVTVAVIITESHITAHTWPELRYAAIDVFTCGDTSGFPEISEFLVRTMRAGRVKEYDIARGPRVPWTEYATAAAVPGSGDRAEDLR